MQKVPALQNLFMKKQGAKFPPNTCLSSTDIATFAEQLDVPIPNAPDPKNPSQPQQLGAFQFEVRYDSKAVCVELVAGPAAGGMICTIQDATNTSLKGIARIGCVSPGKNVFPNTHTAAGRHLADVIVRPQPELYSQVLPNQENGVVVQLLNQNCKLSDLQGHIIPIFSCEDADLTVRYLEGDITGDCAVDVMDTQAIAFRWGAATGSLLYNTRDDLVPSGQIVGDGQIDINDLQFVYGRFPSTCASPWPPQPPANPKG
jgi:hypothetical protein